MSSAKWFRFGIVLVLIICMVGLTMPAAAKSAEINPNWLTYRDIKYDFTIDYPENWYIDPRDDTAGMIGGTVSFTNLPVQGDRNTSDQDKLVVTIGFYLTERDPFQPLSDWTDLYEEQSRLLVNSFDVTTIEHSSDISNQLQAVYWKAISPNGAYEFTNLSQGKVVWFIWSNLDADRAGIYQHLVESFKLGKKAPQTLQDAYGESFVPASLDILPLSTAVAFPDEVSPMVASTSDGGVIALGTDPSGYRLPFTGTFGITCGPRCCSSHSSLPEAIDYGLSVNTHVKSTYGGVVSSFGWRNDTYGNVLTIDHGGSPTKRSLYAHLNSFVISYIPQVVAKGEWVASSGDTGTGGAHLHFEVNTTSGSGLWIRTLPTTTWYSGDANNPCSGTDSDPDGTATGPA